jgi:hypothetical protein
MVKLWGIGVRGRMWRMLREWHCGLESVVAVDGVDTRRFGLGQGVKQGGVLSPLLYALFVDGVVGQLKSRGLGVCEEGVWVGVLLYADDMVLVAETEVELREMMRVVTEYSRVWRFELSVKKTKVMVCGEARGEKVRREGEGGWWIGGERSGGVVEEVTEFKYLGVWLCANGKWGVMSEKVEEKVMRSTRMFFSRGCCWEKLGCGLRCRLWEGVVRPIMEFGSEIWWPSKGGKRKLELAQVRAGRKVLRVGAVAKVPEVVVRGELGWLSCEARSDVARMRYLVKMMNMCSEWGVRRFFVVRLEEARRGGGKVRCRRGWVVKMLELLMKYGLEMPVSGVVEGRAWLKRARVGVFRFEEERWFNMLSVGGLVKLEWYRYIKRDLRRSWFIGENGWGLRCGGLVRLRAGIAELRVETGRYAVPKLKREERLCEVCDMKVVEDLGHFMLECPCEKEVREGTWKEVRRVLMGFECGSELMRVIRELSCKEKVCLLLGGIGSELEQSLDGRIELYEGIEEVLKVLCEGVCKMLVVRRVIAKSVSAVVFTRQ